MKIVLLTILGFVVAAVAYVEFTPSVIDPIAWQPAPNPGMTGPYTPNERLAEMEKKAFGENQIGPEDITLGPDGFYYTGLENGNIVKFSPAGESAVFVNTGGRPLGMAFDSQGDLIVADAYKGLIAINPQGDIRILTDSVDGKKMLFVDDLDIADDGTVWFSDASARFDFEDFIYDFLEARPSGRLLSWSPETRETKVHMTDLFFANGVALGPNDQFVLVNETGTGRIHRLWLQGEKAGQKDLFHEGLPGGPDNLSFNGKDTFWVALPAIRAALTDGVADKPLVRKALAKFPKDMLHPEKVGFVVGLDLEGKVVHNLQTYNSDRFHTITSVNEFNDQLYLGSLAMDSVGIVSLR